MNPRILVVEDESIVALEIMERLETLDYRPVGHTGNGEQALALTGLHKPDLVLMDIRLQGPMDGITAAGEIHQRFHVPVIFLTANSEDITIDRAKLANPYGYILKPFDDRELRSTIEIALYRRRTEEEIRRLNRLYDVLSHVNQAIVRIRSREELLAAVCRLVVERGAVDLAWVSRFDPDTAKVSTIAHFGNYSNVLNEAFFLTGAHPHSEDDPGPALREGNPFVCNDCSRDGCVCLPEEARIALDFRSCASFPLSSRGRVWGALNLFAREEGFFSGQEVELLKRVTMDLSFAIDKIESDLRREQAEESLRESEMRYRKLFDEATEGIVLADALTGEILECNRTFSLLSGYDRSELIGKPQAMLHPGEENCSGGSRTFVQHRGDKEGMMLETELLTKSGSVRQVEIKANIITVSGRSVIQGFFRDVTEIKEGEELFAQIFQQSPAIITITRMSNGQIMEVNDAYVKASGFSREEAIGKSSVELNHWAEPSDRDSFISILREIGFVRNQEVLLRSRSGEVFPALCSMAALTIKGEQCILTTVIDISDRKRAEEEKLRLESQLRQAQKLEAVGTLAGGIAHDFNNILAVIIGYAEMAQMDGAEGFLAGEDLREVTRAAYRARDLVRQILAFSRKSEQERTPVRVDLIVKEAMKMLRASLPSTIEIKTNVGSKSTVMADPTQVHQVLMNLATNAAHAMREQGGVLDVSLTDALVGNESVPPHSDLAPGPFVKLSVKDTGGGIDPAIMDRIFDPFFTTKAQGEGTGLGLSVVHGIVKNHGGFIEMETTPGRGTTFTVYVPAMESAQEPETVNCIPHCRGGNERILLVDDEPALGSAVKRMLERLGYEVEYCASSTDALRTFRLQSEDRPFHLVITDMTMPRLTGADLARKLLRLRPGLPVILYTGFSERMDADRAKDIGIAAFLMKPIVAAELAGKIDEVLHM